jgi:hypothetical protein
MSALYTISCQQSGSLLIHTFTVLHITLVYTRMYLQYIQGLCQSRIATADHALTHVAHVTKAA